MGVPRLPPLAAPRAGQEAWLAVPVARGGSPSLSPPRHLAGSSSCCFPAPAQLSGDASLFLFS